MYILREVFDEDGRNSFQNEFILERQPICK
jgi:hypothetical protein